MNCYEDGAAMLVIPASKALSEATLQLLHDSNLIALTDVNGLLGMIVPMPSDIFAQKQAIEKIHELRNFQISPNDSNLPSQRSTVSTAAKFDSSPQEQSHAQVLDAKVSAVIRKQNYGVQKLLEEVMPELMSENAQIKSTGTAGGDLRFYFTRVNFAEIRFQTNAMLFRLRVGEGTVNHPDMKYCNGTDGSTDIAQVRVAVGQPIHEKLYEWIRKAKVFTKTIN